MRFKRAALLVLALAVVCGGAFLRWRRHRLATAGWYRLRQSFQQALAQDQGSVVFFGDSITEYWRHLDRYFPGLKVANRGIGGDTSLGLLWRLKADVLDLHPKAVVLLIGVNDLSAGASPREVASNIDRIVAFIQAAKAKTPVILCHVMPRERRAGLFPEKIIELNGLIDGVAAKRADTAVCDTFALFADAQGASRTAEFPDRVHPNERAYAKWRDALKPLLARLGTG